MSRDRSCRAKRCNSDIRHFSSLEIRFHLVTPTEFEELAEAVLCPDKPLRAGQCTDMTSARLDPLAYLGEQLAEWKKAGTYQRLRILEGPSAAESRFDGKDVINLASNNYLGLTTHPKLIEAAIEATRKYGAGSGAVRTISGTMDLHMELERRIAKFKNVEACVVFQSGFAANAGTVAAVLDSGRSHHLR